MRIAAHGVTMKAMASEKNIAALEPIGNRAHVGAHQPADERHRQHRGDDREGGKDGWIADFVHGFDGDVRQLRPLFCGR